MFEIIWSKKASKQLSKLPHLVAKRIHRKVGRLCQDPYSLDIKRLIGEPYYRLRVGDYRVFFDIQKNELRILKVGHRKGMYKKI